ncbi:type VI secretion system baseplate subunit TssF [Jannaschia sp. LMIT008]|uniref:type VI secretion system baseplate subunit TssF n=1 Tax=Jannaschia maritima TaxID=3032585 RepID=UPI00281166ED|nr:type VI secretion system baseplate subunit TssF [Jannaschia sp. LMIT008]
MRKAFRDAYERELALLYERGASFAAEYPGIAGQLGGLLQDNTDPAIAGLLEGTAFLAARVQLKLDEEFRGFTDELLDQIFPDALAPLPSMMIVQARLPADPVDPASGRTIPAGAPFQARLVERSRSVACRFRTGSPLTLWPLVLRDARYLSGAAAISALGQDAHPRAQAAVTVDLATVGAGVALGDLGADDLPLHILSPMGDAVALYEQVFADTVRVSLRWLDAKGDARFRPLPPDAVQQIGLDPDERLLPHDERLFDGFALLREGLAFPRKVLGLRLAGLRRALHGIPADAAALVWEFDRRDDDLAARFGPAALGLHCAPAVNLFEDAAQQIRLDGRRHEYVVTPQASPVTHHEVHRILDVQAHYTASRTKRPVRPLYGTMGSDDGDPRHALYYTTRRRERRLTEEELRHGHRHRYMGTETLLSFWEPPAGPDRPDGDTVPGPQRLAVRVLCSNRHLPASLPDAQAADAFTLDDDQTVPLRCVAGPTPPREPLDLLDADAPHRATAGNVQWRLISYLALSQFGIGDRSGGTDADGLREMLSLFADLSDPVAAAQVAGLESLATRPVTRLIRHGDGHAPARGVEVRLTFDEGAFEGSGPMLLGAVLDRFLAEYAPVNSFTQTVVATRQRGDLKAWPPRSGSGPVL